ncbi:MAG: CoA transferase [Chloroflexi bacterium]|nr:CoA transferase [Chloroflexota bacterium]
MPPPAQSLSGLTVLDLTWGIAGPYCSKVLAGLGAEVIKVERPSGGDPSRSAGPFVSDQPSLETGVLHLDLNQGKKSLTLNLKSAVGRDIVRSLAATADIFLESFHPGVVQRLGLDFDAVRRANRRITYLSLSNYGQDGPYRDYKTSDMLLFGGAGEMNSTGLPERTPIRLGNYTQQYQSGNMAAAAALIAYYGTRDGSDGQYIDMSLYETTASSVDRRMQYMVSYAYTGRPGQRRDSVYSHYPTGNYPCKDGFYDIFGGPQFFTRILDMMGMPEVAKDPRFSTPKDLVDVVRKDEFDSIFLPWVTQKTMRELLKLSQQYSVYAAPIFTPKDVYEDEHMKARGFFLEVDHPVVGKALLPGEPAKMSATPYQVHPAPTLGRHNEEILVGRLGYSRHDTVALRQAGVI